MEKKWHYILTSEGKTLIVNDTYEEISKIPFSTLSAGYKTEEELIKECGILETPCCECGNHIYTNYIEPVKSRLIKNSMCHTCDFWTEKLPQLENDRVYIVNNHMYRRADDDNSRNSFKGFGGSLFKIKRFGQETILESRNMWSNGTVPEHFRDRIKNNAEFIKQ